MSDGLKFLAFTVVSVFLLVVMGFAIAAVDLSDQQRLSARFDDVTGLDVGDDVRVAGVPVGSVVGIRAAEGRAVVDMELRADLVVPDDSEIAVRWLDLIGQRQVDVFLGTSDAALADGAEFRRTRSVTDVGDLVDQLGPFGQVLDPRQINDVLEAITEALEGDGVDLRPALEDLSVVVATVNDRRDVLEQLLTDATAVTGLLVARDAELRTVLDNLVLLTDTLVASEDVLDRALVDISSGATSLDALLDRDAAVLEAVVADLSQVTSTLAGRVDDLDTVIPALAPAFEALTQVTSRGEFAALSGVCVEVGNPPCDLPRVLRDSDAGGTGSLGDVGTLGRLLLPDALLGGLR